MKLGQKTNEIRISKLTSFELSKAMTFSKIFSKIKISPTSRLVLRCLVDHWNSEKQFCYPSQQTISEETGASLRSVKKAVQELRQAGLILSELKTSLNYVFTSNFFELAKVAPGGCRNGTLTGAETAPKQRESNNINNKPKFQKNYFQKNEGITYKTPEQTKAETEASRTIDNKSPFNDKDTAIKYLSDIAKEPQNEFILKVTDKIKKIWNL